MVNSFTCNNNHLQVLVNSSITGNLIALQIFFCYIDYIHKNNQGALERIHPHVLVFLFLVCLLAQKAKQQRSLWRIVVGGGTIAILLIVHSFQVGARLYALRTFQHIVKWLYPFTGTWKIMPSERLRAWKVQAHLLVVFARLLPFPLSDHAAGTQGPLIFVA